ncbi:hypothetical protein IT413_02720 [Candidatus Peregrinibacteria bacterium]|nr:hypothetical protein [Candidatus Peregrinibacteria bacterium]
MHYEIIFLKGLLFTIVAELGAGILFRILETKLGFFRKKVLGGVKWWKFVVVIAMASVMTLPYVWFVLPYILAPKIVFQVVAELFAWLMEAVFYAFCFKLKTREAIVFSFVLNLVSVVLGLLFFKP